MYVIKPKYLIAVTKTFKYTISEEALLRGNYLAQDYSLCLYTEAAVFDSAAEARQFFYANEKTAGLKFTLVEVGHVCPDPNYDPNKNPRRLLMKKVQSESEVVRKILKHWLKEKALNHSFSRQQIRESQQVLLRYGVNILAPLPKKLQFKRITDFVGWDNSPPPLHVVPSTSDEVNDD
jgi:hypothetical protein